VTSATATRVVCRRTLIIRRWREVLETCEDITKAAFCRAHGIAVDTLETWIRDERQETDAKQG